QAHSVVQRHRRLRNAADPRAELSDYPRGDDHLSLGRAAHELAAGTLSRTDAASLQRHRRSTVSRLQARPRRLAGGRATPDGDMRHSLLELELANDRDMITARQRARQVSALLDFDAQDQVRIATAISEVARNAVRHGGGGRIDFALEEENGRKTALAITIVDQ